MTEKYWSCILERNPCRLIDVVDHFVGHLLPDGQTKTDDQQPKHPDQILVLVKVGSGRMIWLFRRYDYLTKPGDWEEGGPKSTSAQDRLTMFQTGGVTFEKLLFQPPTLRPLNEYISYFRPQMGETKSTLAPYQFFFFFDTAILWTSIGASRALSNLS